MPASWVLEAIYVVKEGWVSQCIFMTIEEVEGAARRGSGPTTTNGPDPAQRYILSPKYKLQNAGPCASVTCERRSTPIGLGMTLPVVSHCCANPTYLTRAHTIPRRDIPNTRAAINGDGDTLA
jgi:hypothetical protein